MQRRFLLDVVIAQGAAIFELFAGEDEALLIGGDAFFVLDLGFDVVDRVGGFDFEGDGFAREGLDEAVGCEWIVGGFGMDVEREGWGGNFTFALLEVGGYVSGWFLREREREGGLGVGEELTGCDISS